MRFHRLKDLDGLGEERVDSRYSRRDDTSLSAFVEQELRYLVPQQYDRQYEQLNALQFFPTGGMMVPSGAMEFGWDSMEHRGEAKWLGSNAHDIPRADVGRRRETSPVRTGVCGYGWNLEEIEGARFAGRPLDSHRAMACRRAMAEFEHRVVLFGDDQRGIPGALSNPATPIMIAANGDWLDPSTTADEMLKDLHAIGTQVWLNTSQIHSPTDLVLPPAHYQRVATTRVPDTASMVLEVFLKSSQFVKSVGWLRELATLGPSGTPRALCYQKSPENHSTVIPLPYQELDPQVRFMETVVPAREKFGGCVWIRPMSAVFCDGI